MSCKEYAFNSSVSIFLKIYEINKIKKRKVEENKFMVYLLAITSELLTATPLQKQKDVSERALLFSSAEQTKNPLVVSAKVPSNQHFKI